MKKVNYKQIQKNFAQSQIAGLGPIEPVIYGKMLKKLTQGEGLTFINIVCPGYKKRRDMGSEEFDFTELSDNVLDCPNVVLMLEKMNGFLKAISKDIQRKIKLETILADIAILNYKELAKRQNVKKVMQKFLLSIKNSGLIDLKDMELLKMSELSNEFRQIPLSGVAPKFARSLFTKVEDDIKNRAREYIGSLVFDRVNKLMSEEKDVNNRKLVIQAKKEIERFVAEYGLAGLAIRKNYKNPIIFFTEPSGYMRGYFYNSFLKENKRLPVLYLC